MWEVVIVIPWLPLAAIVESALVEAGLLGHKERGRGDSAPGSRKSRSRLSRASPNPSLKIRRGYRLVSCYPAARRRQYRCPMGLDCWYFVHKV